MTWKLPAPPRTSRHVGGLRAPLAGQLLGLADLAIAELGGDVGARWEAVAALADRPLNKPLRSIVRRHRALLELLYGSPEHARELVDRSFEDLVPEVQTEAEVVLLWACWMSGRPLDARAQLARLHDRDPHDRGDVALVANRELLQALLADPVAAP